MSPARNQTAGEARCLQNWSACVNSLHVAILDRFTLRYMDCSKETAKIKHGFSMFFFFLLLLFCCFFFFVFFYVSTDSNTYGPTEKLVTKDDVSVHSKNTLKTACVNVGKHIIGQWTIRSLPLFQEYTSVRTIEFMKSRL